MINTNDATKLLPSPKSLPKKRTNCKVKGCTRQIQSNFSGHCCRCYKDKYPNRYAKIRAAIKNKSSSNDDGINHKKRNKKRTWRLMNCTNPNILSQLSNSQIILIL